MLPLYIGASSLQLFSLPFLFLINNTEKGEFSFRLPYASITWIRLMGMISARHVKAPRILKSADKDKGLFVLIQNKYQKKFNYKTLNI
jgi:hypothetical protein